MNKIENKNSFKKFLSVFTIASIVMLLGVGCLTYIVDPFSSSESMKMDAIF